MALCRHLVVDVGHWARGVQELLFSFQYFILHYNEGSRLLFTNVNLQVIVALCMTALYMIKCCSEYPKPFLNSEYYYY